MHGLLLLPLLVLPVSDASWNFMNNTSQGDTFTYHICDEKFLDSFTGERSRCYTITLGIKNIISAKNDTFYFIHAITEDSQGVQDRLFLLDSAHNIRHIFFKDSDYARSLEDTIFWQDGWGGSIETAHGSSAILLEKNNPESALFISKRTIAQNGAVQYTAIHKGFEQSKFEINQFIPLPVSADIFSYGSSDISTRHLFSFELQNYTSSVVSAGHNMTYPEIDNNHFEVGQR